MCAQVLVGILACNQKEKTFACLESLAASNHRDFEVFLIDNGSGENIGAAAKKYSFVTSHTEPHNEGAAAGRNRILRHFLNEGDWPYLLFLDNDAVLMPDTLDKALEHAQEMQTRGIPLGGLGAHIVYRNEPEKYWTAGGALIDWENSWFRDGGQGFIRGKDFSLSRRLDAIPTAFFLVTREAAQKTGYFIEDYFFYFEDADWSWRMVKAGFELWSVPDLLVLHDVSSSVGSRSPQFYYLRTRNRMWFFQAFSTLNPHKIRWRIFKDVMAASAYPEFREGKFKAALAVILGYVAGIRLPPKLRMTARHS